MSTLKTPALLLVLVVTAACSGGKHVENEISSDPVLVQRGQVAFTQMCGSCHNFVQDGIGPQLSGVTSTIPSDWMTDFIRNPQEKIVQGDKRATALYHRFGTYMPSFSFLPDSTLTAIIAFLNTHKEASTALLSKDVIKNPIPAAIRESGLVVQLKQVAQIPPSSDQQPVTRINKLTYIPGTQRRFVVDLRGKLYELRDKPAVYLDLKSLLPNFIDDPGLATGFGSVAFDPEFRKNGLFYTTHTEKPGSAKADFGYADSIKVTVQWVLTQWKADNPSAATFKGTSRELLRVNMVSGIHGLQEVTFNPQSQPGSADYRLLYLSVGDGGSAENGFPFLEHSLTRIWGTIIRIDPAGMNSTNGHYGIPSSNPFAHARPDTVREIYAYGFRNPHRITWLADGRMLATNIGQAQLEEINVIHPGADYGWPVREGTFAVASYQDINDVVPLPADDSAYHYTYPVAQYDHDEGKAISGGFDYTNSAIPLLDGKYLFGDIPTGRLFYVNVSDLMEGKEAPVYTWHVSLNGNEQPLDSICGDKRVDLRLGKDENGDLYILTKPDGKIYQLMAAKQVTDP